MPGSVGIPQRHSVMAGCHFISEDNTRASMLHSTCSADKALLRQNVDPVFSIFLLHQKLIVDVEKGCHKS